MQFAGQRTDLQLNPIGQPHDVFIQLPDDVLPEPDAILVTGLTPQHVNAEGLSEVDFLKLFYAEIATADTIFVGFNSVRFDDEFMRFLHWRNFYDAYEWQWSEGRSRWDMLDLVRMTRALRPDHIQWPFDSSGAPSNRLELLTAVNKLEHTDAHNALADVQATLAVARLIYNKQTKLFDYLLGMRQKAKVAALVNAKQPFVYSSGKYPSEFEKTTVVVKVADHPKRQAALVYDLRHDPTPYATLSPAKLAELWRWKKDKTEPRLPIKVLSFNRCPAVAPLNVLDETSQQRLQLDLTTIQTNLAHVQKITGFAKRLQQALELLDQQQQTELLSNESDVDGQLYDNFIGPEDKTIMSALRAGDPAEISSFAEQFKDPRLSALVLPYKARNFRHALTADEREAWERHRERKLLQGTPSRLERYLQRLQELAAAPPTARSEYLLQELQLYAESIVPDSGE